ncbi:MAG: PAS domain S-box protein [Thermodesulfobacteriota bacterium]|nr:PAS domain S-box protein [Thermodesulfobacteriota bacterium]
MNHSLKTGDIPAMASIRTKNVMEMYRALFDLSPDAVYICDLQGRFLDANDPALELAGYKREDIPHIDLFSLLEEAQVKTSLDTINDVKKEKKKQIFQEYRIKRGDGRYIWVETLWVTIHEGDTPVCIQGVARDISEQKKIEEKLSIQQKFAQIITRISTKFINLGHNEVDQGIDDALETIGQFAGIDRCYVFLADETHKKISNTNEWCSEWVEPEKAMLQDLDIDTFEWGRQILENDEILYIPSVSDLPGTAANERAMFEAQDIKSLVLVPLVSHGTVTGFMGFDSVTREKQWSRQDISLMKIVGEIISGAIERRRMQGIILGDERRYRLLAETARELILVMGLDGRITYVNTAFLETTGYTSDEIMDKPMRDIIPEYLWTKYKKYIAELADKKQFPILYEGGVIKKDMSLLPVEVSISMMEGYSDALGVLCISRDISERKLIDEQKNIYEQHLMQSQRIESLGILAGGIAHDFNNILSATINYSELLQDNCIAGTRDAFYIEEILKAGDRATNLVRQILTFSRQTDPQREPIPIHLVLREALHLLRASIPATIELVQNIDPASGTIFADPTQIHQMIMNLITNAFQAIEDQKGIIGITLKRVHVDAEFAMNHLNLHEGEYLNLIISDTGKGMDLHTKEKMFYPFFTTKGKNKGSGLGLAMVHGIVSELKGAITVHTQKNIGTTLSVFLPRHNEEAIEIMDETVPQRGSGERILYVDDEEAILRSSEQMLKRLGYEVTTSKNGRDALEIFENNPDRFDLVITDQTMPLMTGMELSQRIMEIRPEIPVILCTGFSGIVSKEAALSKGINGYVMKPVSRNDMADTIHGALKGTLSRLDN